MLSSITPLGQRSRASSWIRAVIAFWLGALIAGAIFFGIVGAFGGLVGIGEAPAWGLVAVVLVAAALEATPIRPPGPSRQVDEDWLGRYRDWVTGFGFGAQLGVGFATIVPSFATWAVLGLALLSGWPTAALMGVGFGVGRSLLLIGTRKVRSGSSLADLMRRFSSAESLARGASWASYAFVILLVGLNVA